MKTIKIIVLIISAMMPMVLSAQSDDNPRKAITLTEQEQELVKHNGDFAFNLLRKCSENSKNLILSPLSITYALGMLNNAATGQTQQEINNVLGFGEAGADAINAFCRKMLTESPTLDKNTKVLLSNAVFVNQGYQLQQSFVQKANEFYDVTPEIRNFNDGETLDIINQWANDHTEGMIKKIMDDSEFNPYLRCYLLNTVYFKGIWTSPFIETCTQNELFNNSETVPMMNQTDYFKYAENDYYQYVELPYGNGAYTMSIILPREDKTVFDLFSVLNGHNWYSGTSFQEVNLKLPRFEIDTNLDLEKIMSALGMPRAFNMDEAEFPYFCIDHPIFIGKMKQVAKIKVMESGTEAAAVTIIGGGSSDYNTEPVYFHANRPFLYLISEQSTKTIYFLGIYSGESNISTTIRPSLSDHSHSFSTPIYNIYGHQVSHPSKGIYIQNGKKIAIK